MPEHAGDYLDIAKLKRQDPAEFEKLYLQYSSSLLQYLTRLCYDPELAHDLLQETFIKAYKALPRTRPELLVRPWLYRIATNTARSVLRSVGWKRLVPFNRSGAEKLSTDFPTLAAFAESELVLKVLSELKPDYAAALLLHWREGFELDELCQMLGISRDTLKKRLYRAKLAFIEVYTRECARLEGGNQ